VCFSEKTLQAGKLVVLKQDHPPAYLSKGGNIVISAVQNKLQFWIVADTVSLLCSFSTHRGASL
jgi:hypothetical protein